MGLVACAARPMYVLVRSVTAMLGTFVVPLCCFHLGSTLNFRVDMRTTKSVESSALLILNYEVCRLGTLTVYSFNFNKNSVFSPSFLSELSNFVLHNLLSVTISEGNSSTGRTSFYTS